MRRSILFSLLVIGSVVGLVAGAGTFSAFTDSAVGNQAVASGDVELQVEGGGVGQDAAFTLALTGCDLTELVPTEVCAHELTITNGGDIAFTFVVHAWSDNANGTDEGAVGPAGDAIDTCFDVAVTIGTPVNPTPPDYTTIDTADNSSETDQPGATGYTGADNTDLDNGDGDMEVLISAVVDDLNACQDQNATIVVSVVATQSATPHD